ncbi:MAG: hypothetical protein A2Y07_00835 [Planctomycetes bacterium GWF2_50_10]|nr:MAG: hypothetical protein A2Y07_00835 [Planctomycetes bacterium GWF2_50_10]
MERILDRRRALHKHLASAQAQNEQLNSQLAQLGALANIGTSTCMIAHEMNNILSPLASYAQLALNHPEDAELGKKALTKTATNAMRAAKILESMLAMASGEQQEKKQCRVALMVQDVFTCLCRDFKKDHIVLEQAIPEDITIDVIPIQMQQVFMNLILNARDAMLPKGGRLNISVSRDGGAIAITFSDTGSGIEAENMDKVFDAFFTTKSHSTVLGKSGAGLGLAFCKKIVEAHGGTISVRSSAGEGSIFSIILPQKV